MPALHYIGQNMDIEELQMQVKDKAIQDCSEGERAHLNVPGHLSVGTDVKASTLLICIHLEVPT